MARFLGDDIPLGFIPKVLLVEDDPVTRWMVRLALKEECMLYTASNAKDAIESFNAHNPDMVLLDIGLPGLNGKNLLKRFLCVDPDAFVIMFTSQNGREIVLESIRSGASGFISKPFEKSDILEYLTECPVRNERQME